MENIIRQPTIAGGQSSEEQHFRALAILCAAIAFLGFAPTYWVPLFEGKLDATPVIHLHAAVFFVWSVYLIYQVRLAASGNLRLHRRVGMIGISIATLMVLLGIATTIHRMHWAAGLGKSEAGQAFALLPISAVVYFGIFFTAAIALARKRDWHKRIMILAALSILDAPIARWFIVFLAPPAPPGPPPIEVGLGPALVVLVIMLIAMLDDRRRTGRIHRAYVIGLATYAAIKLLLVPVSATAGWHAVTVWLMRIGA